MVAMEPLLDAKPLGFLLPSRDALKAGAAGFVLNPGSPNGGELDLRILTTLAEDTIPNENVTAAASQTGEPMSTWSATVSSDAPIRAAPLAEPVGVGNRSSLEPVLGVTLLLRGEQARR